MVNKETIEKEINALVDQHLEVAPSATPENVEKAMPASMPENGGKDAMHSGSPYSEKEAAEMKKKKEKEQAEKDEVEKAKKEAEEKESKKHEGKESKKEEKNEMKKASELGDLDEEEIELVKAWRAEKLAEAETVAKSQSGLADADMIAKAVSDAIGKQIEPLKKAIEDKDSKIDELEKSIKKLASQPAYDKRSISTLETIEKGGSQEQEISKAQVLDTMLKLQMAGKGVRSNHIAEFESTGNISNTEIKNLVMGQFK